MKKQWFSLPLLISTIIGSILLTTTQINANSTTQKTISLDVNPNVAISKPERIGINLGDWTTWGAEQFSNNILANPGFEGKIDRVIVFVKKVDGFNFFDDKDWGYPDGHWNGATYNIRTGSYAGTTGIIKTSIQSGDNGLPQYISETPLPPLEENDAIVLTKIDDSAVFGSDWDIATESEDNVHVSPSEKRPGSNGKQSIRFTPKQNEPAQVNFYLDHITGRAGKLLLVEGKWRLKLWLKAEGNRPSVEIYFRRMSEAPEFLHETITPSSEWKEYTIDFDTTDDGPKAIIQFAVIAHGSDARIWMDDVWLGKVQETDSPFREELIQALKTINPSYIRENFRFSDTMENRIADPSARRSMISRGWLQEALFYSYSLPEFLDLCERVGANPWLVIPTTFSDEEYEQLGKFLSEHANKTRFPEVIAEYGNENWNWLFRAAVFTYPEPHGKAFDRAFEFISRGAGDNVNINSIVNGQMFSPGVSSQYLKHATTADTLAVAGYFMSSLDKGTPDQKALELLFEDTKDFRFLEETAEDAFSKNKNFAIYEVNLHTSEGDAPDHERDRVVAGTAAGSALAKRLIKLMFLGADPLIISNLAQYDSRAWDIEGFVKLWGIARDLNHGGTMRPTGLAVIMLNHILKGDMHYIDTINSSTSETNKLTTAAFKTDKEWTAAVVSENNTPITLEITFPNDGRLIPSSMEVLHSKTPFDTNEKEEKVTIKTENIEYEDRMIRFTVPAWGLIVLYP